MSYPNGIDEIHVVLKRQRHVLQRHQFREDHRELHYLAKVDQGAAFTEPVVEGGIQGYQVFQMNTSAKQKSDE